MKFKIHFTLNDGTEDSIVVSGDTLEEIREKAYAELDKRGGRDAWSEEL
jgi:hypothetical protein